MERLIIGLRVISPSSKIAPLAPYERNVPLHRRIDSWLKRKALGAFFPFAGVEQADKAVRVDIYMRILSREHSSANLSSMPKFTAYN